MLSKLIIIPTCSMAKPFCLFWILLQYVPHHKDLSKHPSGLFHSPPIKAPPFYYTWTIILKVYQGTTSLLALWPPPNPSPKPNLIPYPPILLYAPAWAFFGLFAVVSHHQGHYSGSGFTLDGSSFCLQCLWLHPSRLKSLLIVLPRDAHENKPPPAILWTPSFPALFHFRVLTSIQIYIKPELVLLFAFPVSAASPC